MKNDFSILKSLVKKKMLSSKLFQEYHNTEKVKISLKQYNGFIYKKIKIKDDMDIIKRYYKNNVLHRDEGPAVVEEYINGWDLAYYYYKNGLKHREDGPAVEIRDYVNNTNVDLYFINDIEYTREEYEIKIVEFKVEEKKSRQQFIKNINCRLNVQVMRQVSQFL